MPSESITNSGALNHIEYLESIRDFVNNFERNKHINRV